MHRYAPCAPTGLAGLLLLALLVGPAADTTPSAVAPALAPAFAPAFAAPATALAPTTRAAPTPAPGAGAERFVKQQTDAAKKALRSKDFDAAESAWKAVLELVPGSVTALNGLAEVAGKRDDVDGEMLALSRLRRILTAAAGRDDKQAIKDLARTDKRLADIDPFFGEADKLFADYAEQQEELGAAYLADAMWANALVAWKRFAELTPPGAGLDRAQVALKQIMEDGGDYVASTGLDPSITSGGRDPEWIAKHDKKSAKWGSAAKWETPHYRIKTNAGWELGQGSAEVMERVHAFYREVWGIVPDPKPKRVDKELRDITIPSIQLDIYRDHAEYLQRSSAPEWSGGVFTGSSVMTYDHGQGGKGGQRATYSTLFHEASHQFMSVAVGSVPSWINEGVASLFEGIELLSNGSIRRDLPVLHYLTPLEKDLRGSAALTLSDVMGGTNAGANQPEFYKYRWGLVYFLRMYVDGQGNYVYRDKLTEFIYSFRGGGPGNTIKHFTEFFITGKEAPEVAGITDMESFEAHWRQWILDLKQELDEEDKRLDEFRDRGRKALIRSDWEEALRFYERAKDIDPDDADSAWGIAKASDSLQQTDRAVFQYRRFLDLSERDERNRDAADKAIKRLDPHFELHDDSRRDLMGGISGLAQRYEREGFPLMAMYWSREVLVLDPYDTAARSLLSRVEEDTGKSVVLWQRMFNGFDLDGWYWPRGADGFEVEDEKLISDSKNMIGLEEGSARDGTLYRTMFLTRAVDGDWTLEVTVEATDAWRIMGIGFGLSDGEHFEGIVLRNRGEGSGTNNLDFARFDSELAYAFRGDGSMKAQYDPTKQPVQLRVEVKGRHASVWINGERIRPIVDGKVTDSMEYPLGALRGDIGLIVSTGKATFHDIRLLAR